jgi:hypothetical protein
MKTAARAETGKHTRGVGADINAVVRKSEHVLGTLGAAVIYKGRNSRKVKS